MKLNKFTGVFLGSLLLSSNTFAQTEPNVSISNEQIKQAQTEMQKAISQASQSFKPNPSQNNISSPRFSFENLPKPESMVRNRSFNELWAEKVLATQSSEGLYKLAVFVSFSMPDSSLEKLFSDGARMGENIVFNFRGLDESKNLQSMLQRIQELNQKYNATINIDPGQFDRFGINSVPAMVVYKDDPTQLQTCLSQGVSPDEIKDSYVGVYGDVSLDYALEHILNLNLSESKRHGVQALLKKVKREL